mgnify:CR=1 FL=1
MSYNNLKSNIFFDYYSFDDFMKSIIEKYAILPNFNSLKFNIHKQYNEIIVSDNESILLSLKLPSYIVYDRHHSKFSIKKIEYHYYADDSFKDFKWIDYSMYNNVQFKTNVKIYRVEHREGYENLSIEYRNHSEKIISTEKSNNKGFIRSALFRYDGMPIEIKFKTGDKKIICKRRHPLPGNPLFTETKHINRLGQTDNINGPAEILADTSNIDYFIIKHIWYKNGYIHNENGPAVISRYYDHKTLKLQKTVRSHYLSGKRVQKTKVDKIIVNKRVIDNLEDISNLELIL